MLATGTINPFNRSFDIAGVNESNTNISTINNTLRLSYTSETGQLIQLVKQINPTDEISIGDKVGLSPVIESNGLGGYAQRINGEGVAQALTNVDWNNLNGLTYKTFTDSNGITRTAVLLPVTMT